MTASLLQPCTAPAGKRSTPSINRYFPGLSRPVRPAMTARALLGRTDGAQTEWPVQWKLPGLEVSNGRLDASTNAGTAAAVNESLTRSLVAGRGKVV